MTKISHQERQRGLVCSSFPQHLLQAVAAEGVPETMQMRSPIFTASMMNPAPEQNPPEIGRYRVY
ncbi:MAG: hypothetical protein LUG59_09125 [Enterocloster clostridioformis]|nr:hypothetical protein [Enterocloster clostridioformis]